MCVDNIQQYTQYVIRSTQEERNMIQTFKSVVICQCELKVVFFPFKYFESHILSYLSISLPFTTLWLLAFHEAGII